MKMTKFTKFMSLILVFVLVAAIALFTTGCGGKKTEAPEADITTTSAVADNSQDKTDESNAKPEDATQLGQGQKTFTFVVKDADGKDTSFEIKSDKKTVGEALLEQELISGTSSEYGLMVDTVMGIKADYNADKAYWAFSVGGEYAQTGVDSTDLVDGEIYMFEYTPA